VTKASADPAESFERRQYAYSTNDVSRLTKVSASRLQRWNRIGLLGVQKNISGHLEYTFSDVVAVRAAKALFQNGIKPKRIREAVKAIRNWRPDIDQPLAAVRVEVKENRIVVLLDGQTIEPHSGQLVFRLEDELPTSVPHVVTYPSAAPPAPVETADTVFSHAVLAEQDGDREQAERGYRRTLTLEPTHPWALINLGNLLFQAGQYRTACEVYRTATKAAPKLAATWYNLANALDEMEQSDAAIAAYMECLKIDPHYADAHFNTALLWEKLGQRKQAQPHWKAFLKLAPDHPSTVTARAFLESQE
jgi:tetratricopeptide (TPR) repeat protein